MIHLRTQSLKDRRGTGSHGEWTLSDTFNLFCDEVRDATYRVDEILRLEDCEKIVREGLDSGDMGLSDIDVAIALQWRGWRDGYISWHLESQRYKLDFLRPEQFQPEPEDVVLLALRSSPQFSHETKLDFATSGGWVDFMHSAFMKITQKTK